jgi:hypothetical protein
MEIARGQVESLPRKKTNVPAFVRHLLTQKKEQLCGETALEYAILQDPLLRNQGEGGMARIVTYGTPFEGGQRPRKSCGYAHWRRLEVAL